MKNKNNTQRNSGDTADAGSVNIKGDNGGCSPTACSASSFENEMRDDTINRLQKTIKFVDENLPKAIKLNWTEQINRFRNMKEKALTDLSRISSM